MSAGQNGRMIPMSPETEKHITGLAADALPIMFTASARADMAQRVLSAVMTAIEADVRERVAREGGDA